MQTPQIDIGISPEVLKQLAEAEARGSGKETSPQSLKDIERQMVDHLSRKASVHAFCLVLGYQMPGAVFTTHSSPA